MATIHSYVEWHDIRIDPDDIPDEKEKVLVTKENYEGTRITVGDVYLKYTDDERYCWCVLMRDDETGRMEETMLWESVVAWASYPKPYIV